MRRAIVWCVVLVTTAGGLLAASRAHGSGPATEVFYVEGTRLLAQQQDGLTVAVSAVTKVGSNPRVVVFVTNETNRNVLFDPKSVQLWVVKNGESSLLKTFSNAEWKKKVETRQAWAGFAAGLAAGVNAYNSASGYGTYSGSSTYGSYYGTVSWFDPTAYQISLNTQLSMYSALLEGSYQAAMANIADIHTVRPGNFYAGSVVFSWLKGRRPTTIAVGLGGKKFTFDLFGRYASQASSSAKTAQPPVSDEPALVATGTGFVVGDRMVATSDHVLGTEGGYAEIFFPGDGTFPVAPVGRDTLNDIALLEVLPKGDSQVPDLPRLSLSQRPARLGEDVYALGFPMANTLSSSVKVTDGLISSLAGVDNDEGYYQVSIPAQPGSSGGPVLNVRGQVVGVITGTLDQGYSLRAHGALPQNVNFALKSEHLQALLPRTLEGRAWDDSEEFESLSRVDQIERLSRSVGQIRVFRVAKGSQRTASLASSESATAQLGAAGVVSQGNRAIEGSPVSREPRLIRWGPPDFPAVAKFVVGEVRIAAEIDEQGRVTRQEVAEGSTLSCTKAVLGPCADAYNGIHTAALAVVSSFRFEPALENGAPIPSQAILKFELP